MPIVPPVLRGRTPDLPTVPPLVQYLIGCFLESILAWLETLVHRLLLLNIRPQIGCYAYPTTWVYNSGRYGHGHSAAESHLYLNFCKDSNSTLRK